jgi:hypothetical protein
MSLERSLPLTIRALVDGNDVCCLAMFGFPYIAAKLDETSGPDNGAAAA